MADGDNNEKELDVEVAGQKVRARGYRLIDLVWLPMSFGIAYTSLTLYQHEANAQQEKAEIAKALNKTSEESRKALLESNMAVVNAIKETNDKTISALNKLTSRATEMACLSDPAMKNRGDAREFCKRMSRGD